MPHVWQPRLHERGTAAIVAPVVGPPDPQEAARRIRAALGYSDIPQKQVYEALSVDRATFARMIGKKGSQRSAVTWDQLQVVAQVCRVSWSWFTADLSRLDEIAQADAPSFTVTQRGAPPIPGDTGSRVAGRPTRPADRPEPGSGQGTDASEGELG